MIVNSHCGIQGADRLAIIHSVLVAWLSGKTLLSNLIDYYLNE